MWPQRKINEDVKETLLQKMSLNLLFLKTDCGWFVRKSRSLPVSSPQLLSVAEAAVVQCKVCRNNLLLTFNIKGSCINGSNGQKKERWKDRMKAAALYQKSPPLGICK